MEMRKLGTAGLQVPKLGLGCMGMSYAYGTGDDAESLRVLDRCLELGITFWDTAEMYGPFKNEELLGRALRNKSRDKITIATKFAWRFDSENKSVDLDSSPAHIRESLEGSLRRLNTDYVDLYYQHRLDPKTPIEDTVGALAELVDAGKVRYIGLSEVGPAIIRRANAVHPISAVQLEYSLWEREIEESVLPAMRELGIGLVAYSPLGRGFLTGRFTKPDDVEENDWRRSSPRFQEDNFRHNMKLVKLVQQIASANDATPAQVALAWVLRQGDDIVPIPGTKRVRYLEENAKAADLQLPDFAWDELDSALDSFEPAGSRYPEWAMQTVDRTG